MLEQFKKNWNIFFSMAIGNLGVANIMLLVEKEHNLSLVVFGIVGVLIGIGALWNESKKQSERLEKISTNQKIIIQELLCKTNSDRKYEYKKDGKTVMLNKAELLHIFMNEEKKENK